jgi:hypothetical protein
VPQQPYEVDLAEAIYPAAERCGYHVVLGAMTAGRDERQAVEELLSFSKPPPSGLTRDEPPPGTSS